MATRILTVPRPGSRRLYPLQLSFSYVARKRGYAIHSGWGETLEIGSSYVRVNPLDVAISEVTDMVMSIAWPAKLPDGTGLQLVIQARPVAEYLVSTEFRIVKYEFRTASRVANGLGLRAGLRGWRDDAGESTLAPQYAAASGM